MNNPRILAVIVFLAIALAAASSIPPAWFAPVGLGREEQPEIHAQTERSTDLDQQSEATHERIRAKVEVTRSLTRGECTLFEAAALFRLIDAAAPYGNDFQRRFPGDSVEEKACRQVIQWVRHAIVPQMERGEVQRQADRLEAELSEHLAKHGLIALPAAETWPEAGLPAMIKKGGSIR